MINIDGNRIRNVALVVALLLAPVLSYGSAYMLYSQIDNGRDRNAREGSELVKAPINDKQELPDDLKIRIAAAIDLAESRR